MDESKVTKVNKKAIVIISAVLVAIFAVTSAYFAYVVSSCATEEGIAKGVTIDGIDVSGLSVTQARDKVLEEKEKILENTLELVMDDKITIAKFSEFGIDYNADEAAVKASECGKSGNIFKRVFECIKIKNGNMDIDLNTQINEEDVSDYVFAYAQGIGSTVVENYYVIEEDTLTLKNGKEGKGIDKEGLTQEIADVIKSGKSAKIGVFLKDIKPADWDVDAVYEELAHEPKEASYEKIDGVGYIVEARPGYKFSKKDLENLIKDNINNTDEYSMKVEIIPPAVTEVDETGLFTEVISEYTSSLAGSDANRRSNVALACKTVNGTILNPGEIFSYNKVIGPVTTATGYKTATIFTSKGHEPGIGGGICQLSSTLYSAALYGDMEIVKRRNHMYIVGYVPYGQDATVYEGELDFRFKNNTNEPLKITSVVSGSTVIVKLLGKKPDNTKKIEIENIIVGRTAPGTVITEDPNLPAGKVVVTGKGTVGLTVDTYKKTFKNGELVSRVFLHRSVYKPISRTETHGIGESQPTQGEAVEGTEGTPEGPSQGNEGTDSENAFPSEKPEGNNPTENDPYEGV
ncbi:MAG: VanW family protein [Clostridia bacterium]|nr:VanW family protein [Clostridia bacterium]